MPEAAAKPARESKQGVIKIDAQIEEVSSRPPSSVGIIDLL